MHQELEILLHVLTAIGCAGLGIYVLSRNPHRPAHRAFAAMTGVMTLWTVGVAFISTTLGSPNQELTKLLIRATFVASCFLPVTFHYFIGVFTRQRFEGPKWFLWFLSVSGVVLSIGVATPWYDPGVTLSLMSNEKPKGGYGPVFLGLLVIVLLTMVKSYPILFRRLRNAPTQERRQIEHVIFGIALFTSLATFTNLILPAVGYFKAQVYGPVSILGMLAFFAYAMVRYHLLDVRMLISRTTTYAVGISFVIVILIGTIAIVSWSPDQTTETAQNQTSNPGDGKVGEKGDGKVGESGDAKEGEKSAEEYSQKGAGEDSEKGTGKDGDTGTEKDKEKEKEPPPRDNFKPERVLPTLLAALVISLALEPLKESVRALLDRTVLKRRYDIHELLSRTTHTASRIVQLDRLLKTVCEDIRETVGVESIRVYLADDLDLKLLTLEYSSVDGEQGRKTWEHGRLLEHFREKPHPLVLKQLIHTQAPDERATMARHLAELDAFLCLPLVSSGGLVGIMTLGDKLNHDIYSAEDIVVFTSLAGPLVTAIENARLYRKLEEVNLHRERILTTMRGGVIAVGPDGRVTTVNQAAQDIVGPVVLGQCLQTLAPPVAQVLSRAVRENENVTDLETTILRAGDLDEGIPVVMSSAPLPSADGNKNSGAVVMIYDLTQIKRLEQNVQRAHRLSSIGTLAAGMAHEIKNPLVSIKTFSQLLLNRYDDPDFRATFVEVVPNEVERIDSIVSQLLDFARPKPVHFAVHDVRDILLKVLLLVENQTRKADIDVRFVVPDEPMLIRADHQQIHQVFLNLILNAIDAMRQTEVRQLTVEVERNGMRLRRPNGPARDTECVRVHVRDTGMGIEPEDLEGIFTPFYTTKEFGTGLGLSVVHGIVTEHGGQIDIDSAPGKGAVFTVSFAACSDVSLVGNDAS